MIDFKAWITEDMGNPEERNASTVGSILRWDKYERIPLVPQMLKRIKKKESEPIVVWHGTSVFNLGALTKLQGKRASISTTGVLSNTMMATGVTGMVAPNTWVKLSGVPIAIGSNDIMTATDRVGRRWIKISEVVRGKYGNAPQDSTSAENALTDKMNKHIFAMCNTISKKFLVGNFDDIIEEYANHALKNAIQSPEEYRDYMAAAVTYNPPKDPAQKKLLDQYVKGFMSGLQKLLMKHMKDLKLFTNDPRTVTGDDGYNEVLLSKIKILDIVTRVTDEFDTPDDFLAAFDKNDFHKMISKAILIPVVSPGRTINKTNIGKIGGSRAKDFFDHTTTKKYV